MGPLSTDPLVVLLPSPLLGPATWAPVAERLAAVVPSPRGEHPDQVLAGWSAELPTDRDLVLVPHSNAGQYVAALAAERRVRGVVYVDARLPTREREPDHLAFLAGLADADGVLPPWTEWWPGMESLYPDRRTAEAVAREARRLPLSYFHAQVPTPEGWADLPSAYVAFGDAYADELAEARRRGWPVDVLEGEHLHQLVDPEAVVQALRRVLTRLGVVRDFP